MRDEVPPARMSAPTRGFDADIRGILPSLMWGRRVYPMKKLLLLLLGLAAIGAVVYVVTQRNSDDDA
jgi:hypothetical protein